MTQPPTPVAPTTPPSRAEWAPVVSVFAAAAILVGLVRLAMVVQGADRRIDFSHYYIAAQFVNEGLNPYQQPLADRCERFGFDQDSRIPVGAHPPLLIRLFTPLALLPPSVAYAVWLVAQLVCLGGLLWTIARIVGTTIRSPMFLAMTAVFLNSTTLSSHFYYSQVQLLVAWMIAGAVLLQLRNRRCLATALATLAAMLKLYPAILLPWFLLSALRDRRDLGQRALAGGLVAASVLAATGLDAWHNFIRNGLPVIQLSVGGSWTNYSLPSLVKMLAGGALGDLANPPDWSGPAGKLLGLAALAVAYARVARGDLKPAAAVSLLVLAMMAASLVCWTHYFVLAALPAAELLCEVRRRETSTFAIYAGLAALLMFPQIDASIPLFDPLWLRVVLHFYPLATGILVACALCTYCRADVDVATATRPSASSLGLNAADSRAPTGG